MSLLVFLAKNPGEVITRKQILEEIWPDVIVGEEVITQIIYSLRNILGDDAKRPNYIETIPKKGYRFIAEIYLVEEKPTEIKTEPVKTAQENEPQVEEVAPRVTFDPFVAGLIFLLIAIGVGLYLTTAEKSAIYHISNISPVTQMKGKESNLAIHDSHNNVLFVYHDGNQADLYIRDLENNQQQQLTDDDWREFSPVWLNADTFFFVRQKKTTFQIVRRNNQQQYSVLYESDAQLMHLMVNQTSPQELFFVEFEHYKNGRLTEIKSLNLINGNIRLLHEQYPELPPQAQLPVFSNDGNTLYFVNDNNKKKTIHSLDLNHKQIKLITDKFDVIGHMSLAEDLQLLVSGTSNGTNGTWHLDSVSKEIQLLLPTASGEEITKSVLSGSRGEVFYSTIKRSYDQVLANIATKEFDQLPSLNSDADEFTAVFSRDDSRLYFVSNRTGHFEIWTYDIATGSTEQLTNLKARMIARPIISPSDSKLAFVYKTEDLNLAVISATDGKVMSATAISYMQHPLSFSENEKKLYVGERRGEVNFYQYDVENLTSTLLQEKAGLIAENKGDSLIFMDYQYRGLVQHNLSNGDITPLTNTIKNIYHLVPGQLRVLEDRVLALNVDNASRQLFQYPLVASTEQTDVETKLLLTLPDGAWLTNYNFSGEQVGFTPEGTWVTDISHNGEQVIFTKNVQSQGNIMKVTLDK